MGAEAVNILYRKELGEAEDKRARAAELAAEAGTPRPISRRGGSLFRISCSRADPLGDCAGAARADVETRDPPAEETRQYSALKGRAMLDNLELIGTGLAS